MGKGIIKDRYQERCHFGSTPPILSRRVGHPMTARTKQYRRDACEAIHETARALHEVGAIDGQAMREFDEACLMPAPLLPEGGGDSYYMTDWDSRSPKS